MFVNYLTVIRGWFWFRYGNDNVSKWGSYWKDHTFLSQTFIDVALAVVLLVVTQPLNLS